MADHVSTFNPLVQLVDRLRKTVGAHLTSLAAALRLYHAFYFPFCNRVEITGLQEEDEKT